MQRICCCRLPSRIESWDPNLWFSKTFWPQLNLTPQTLHPTLHTLHLKPWPETSEKTQTVNTTNIVCVYRLCLLVFSCAPEVWNVILYKCFSQHGLEHYMSLQLHITNYNITEQNNSCKHNKCGCSSCLQLVFRRCFWPQHNLGNSVSHGHSWCCFLASYLEKHMKTTSVNTKHVFCVCMLFLAVVSGYIQNQTCVFVAYITSSRNSNESHLQVWLFGKM